jgi:hypothetical protein
MAPSGFSGSVIAPFQTLGCLLQIARDGPWQFPADSDLCRTFAVRATDDHGKQQCLRTARLVQLLRSASRLYPASGRQIS